MAAALCGAGASAGTAWAQARPTGVAIDTVTSRARPEYDAVGIGLGGFTLYPEVAMNVAYDSNIYRTAAPKRSDVYGQIRPSLRLDSLSPLYPLSVVASATVARYARIKTENSEQYSVSGNGGAEIAAGTRIGATARYARLLEPRGTAGDLFIGGRPIAYNLLQAGLTASRDVGVVSIDVAGAIDRYRYGTATTAGGVRADQRFRDYDSTTASVQVAYALSPAVAAFVRGGIDRSRYPQFTGLDRDARGYSVLAGVQLGLSNLVTGSVGIGYLHEAFADPAYRTISGLDYDVALTWNPTPLDAVSLRGARNLQRSPFVGSAGGIETRLGIGATHELLRQLILRADLDYTRVSYRGLTRSDRYGGGRIGARYLVSRIAAVTLDVTYSRQSSAGLGARDFNGFGASIGVTLHR